MELEAKSWHTVSRLNNDTVNLIFELSVLFSDNNGANSEKKSDQIGIGIMYVFLPVAVTSTLRSLLFAGTNFSGFHDSLI